MTFLKRYQDYIILFSLFLLSFFYATASVPLFNLDEGAFSEATREMLRNGDLVTTYLGGELRFDKPILIYWLQLLSVKIFGINEFSFRLPSALSAFFWGVCLYLFTKRNFDRKKAFWSAFLFASSLQITVIGKAAVADALLNLFIASTMFCMWEYFKTRKRKYLYLLFSFMALGTLTKGPIAVFIPFFVSFFYLLAKGRLDFWLRSVFDPKGLLLFFLIALPWYAIEYLKEGEAFIEGFIIKHNIQRFNSAFENHKGGFFYYVPVLLAGLLPFTGVILHSLLKIRKNLNDLTLFLLIWFSFVFIFFSFSQTKLPHYIIYGYTPLFIIASLAIDDFRSKKAIVFPVLSLFLLFLFLPEAASFFKDSLKGEYLKEIIENAPVYFNFFYKAKIAAAILILTLAYFLEDFKKIAVITGFATLFVINSAVIPAYASLVEAPVKEAGIFIKKLAPKNAVMYGINTPSLMVYADRIVKRKYPENGDVVFTKIDKLKEFKKYEILWEKNGIVVIKKIF